MIKQSSINTDPNQAFNGESSKTDFSQDQSILMIQQVIMATTQAEPHIIIALLKMHPMWGII